MSNHLTATTERASKQKKVFVLDTNVFIHRPDALISFRDNEIVIPLWVLEELDKLKSGTEERARNARQAIRLIDSFSKRGKLSEGVYISEINSTLIIAMTYDSDAALDMDMSRMDNKIILSALHLKKFGRNVFFCFERYQRPCESSGIRHQRGGL